MSQIYTRVPLSDISLAVLFRLQAQGCRKNGDHLLVPGDLARRLGLVKIAEIPKPTDKPLPFIVTATPPAQTDPLPAVQEQEQAPLLSLGEARQVALKATVMVEDGLRADRAQEACVSVTPPPPRPIRDYRGLKLRPWRHQADGIDFALSGPIKDHRCVALAAEMGTGKTLMATAICLELQAKAVLIVCPLRVIGSWVSQLRDYVSLRYTATPLDDSAGTVEKRVALAEQRWKQCKASGDTHFVIVNYDVVWREEMRRWIASKRWDVVIYDESHKLKSPSGRASVFARQLRSFTDKVILASGTILSHSPLDAFGQFRAAAPWVFGSSYVAFRNKYAVLGGPQKKWVAGYQNVQDLEDKMAPLTYRVTKREALPDLPSEQELTQSTTLKPEAMRIYKSLEREMIAEIEGETITAANAMVKMLRLQQLTGGSLPTDDGKYHQVDDGKKLLLADVVEDLGDKPVVIFCRFRADIDAAHEACKEAGAASMELSGVRNDLEEWQAGKGQALVVQVQSGSVGISLVRASVAIYYSLSSSLAEFDQSRARIHRPGQKHNCLYLYLVAKGTIDEQILESLRAREEVISGIMRRVKEKQMRLAA